MSVVSDIAKQAIEQSIAGDRIVTLDYDLDLLAELETLSDNSVEAFGVTEFWGRDDAHNTWRVHVRDERGSK